MPASNSDAALRQLNQSLANQAMARNRELKEIQALTHLGSWEWNITTDTVKWSDELYRVYGLKPRTVDINFERYIGMIHPDDQEYVKQTIGQAQKSAKPFRFEHRIILPNGQTRVLLGLGKVVKNKAGELVRMYGTAQDITDQRRTEQALLQSDERFRAVSNATHDLIYDMDLMSGQTWFNDVLETHYGYTAADKQTDTTWLSDHMHPDDLQDVREQYYKILKNHEQTWAVDYRFQRADGSYAIVRNRAYIIRDEANRPVRIIGSCQDITHQRQLDRAKDEFISLVSHQLRTPLTVIRLYGNMLLDGIAGPLGRQQRSYVNKMTVASIRLIKLVGDILNISRIELNRIKIDCSPHDANMLIRNCLEELTPVIKEKQATIIFTPDIKLGKVVLDATLFSEIVHNLVGNALRYGQDSGGEVSVSFRKSRKGYILKVQDNGQGIPRTDQQHIFERFYRAQNAAAVDSDGSGLGLYMVKLFCEAAGGTVWFESAVHKGTTFYVQFPLRGMQPPAGKLINQIPTQSA
jgi:PAS domain S-box-containing protein